MRYALVPMPCELFWAAVDSGVRVMTELARLLAYVVGGKTADELLARLARLAELERELLRAGQTEKAAQASADLVSVLELCRTMGIEEEAETLLFVQAAILPLKK